MADPRQRRILQGSGSAAGDLVMPTSSYEFLPGIKTPMSTELGQYYQFHSLLPTYEAVEWQCVGSSGDEQQMIEQKGI